MHPFPFVVVIMLAATPVLAGSKVGGDDNTSGRLGQVSRGIDKATSAPSSSAPSRNSSADNAPTDRWSRDSDPQPYVLVYDDGCASCREPRRATPKLSLPPLHVGIEGFAGAQKVFESDGSLSAAFSVIFQRRVRLNAAVSHYFEDQMDGSRVTLTAPSLTLGVRIGELRATKLWLEAGATQVRTNDPAGSSSLLGSTLGGRLEHQLSSDASLVASGGAMLFDGVQAYTGRAGVRFHHVEAAFRVLDFSVGPALYGPELGVTF